MQRHGKSSRLLFYFSGRITTVGESTPLVIRFKRPVYQPQCLFPSKQPSLSFSLPWTLWVHSGDYKICSLGDFFPGYIGEFEIVDDHRSGKIVVQLNGRLNKTGVISPRYNVQVNQIENWVNLLLPARGFGIIILVCRRFEAFSARCTNLTIPDDLLGYLGP